MTPQPAGITGVTFKPGRGKAFLCLLGCLCLLAAGIWMAPTEPWVGWACVMFGGLGTLAFVLLMFPNNVYLRVDASGFEMRSLFRKGTTRWSDVAHVGLASMNHSKVIGIVYTDAYRERRFGSALGFALAGMDAVIGNLYAAPLEEIVVEMNAWKSRAQGTGF